MLENGRKTPVGHSGEAGVLTAASRNAWGQGLSPPKTSPGGTPVSPAAPRPGQGWRVVARGSPGAWLWCPPSRGLSSHGPFRAGALHPVCAPACSAASPKPASGTAGAERGYFKYFSNDFTRTGVIPFITWISGWLHFKRSVTRAALLHKASPISM